jgi:hypothetical protein
LDDWRLEILADRPIRRLEIRNTGRSADWRIIDISADPRLDVWRLEILADRPIGRLENLVSEILADWTIGDKKYWPIGRLDDWRLEILGDRPIRRLENYRHISRSPDWTIGD